VAARLKTIVEASGSRLHSTLEWNRFWTVIVSVAVPPCSFYYLLRCRKSLVASINTPVAILAKGVRNFSQEYATVCCRTVLHPVDTVNLSGGNDVWIIHI
jgi:hypothetical protein